MTTIFYSVYGSINEPVHLFLHGFLGSGKDWAPIIKQSPKNHCYITVDLPGHGKSLLSDDTAYSFNKTAQLIIDVLDELNIQKCHLIGYSLGGRIALYAALHYPNRFTHLTLESASPGLETENERDTRLINDKVWVEKLKKLPLSEFLDQWYAQPLFNSLRQHKNYPQLFEKRLNNTLKFLEKALLGFSVATMPNLTKKLANLNIPLSYVSGALDKKYLNIGQTRFNEVKDYTHHVVKDVGHNVHDEDLNQFNNILWFKEP